MYEAFSMLPPAAVCHGSNREIRPSPSKKYNRAAGTHEQAQPQGELGGFTLIFQL
jgi:hypothetical protein